MKVLYLPVVALGIVLSASAFAQGTSGNSTSQHGSSGSDAQAGSSANASGNQHMMANAQKIKQDLQNAGFSDVNVVAESFVVQAKTKDGDPVVMTIGPHGMTVFEVMNASKSGSTGSTSGGSTGSTGGASTGSATGAQHK